MIMIDNNIYYFFCPHQNCQLLIAVEKNMINCKIFRHAIIKGTMENIDPHTKEEECLKLKENNLIYGCGKPFKFDGEKVEICDYI